MSNDRKGNIMTSNINLEDGIDWTSQEQLDLNRIEQIARRDYTTHVGHYIQDADGEDRWVLGRIKFLDKGTDKQRIDIQVFDTVANGNLAAGQRWAAECGLVYRQVHAWHPELSPDQFLSTTAAQLVPEDDIKPRRDRKTATAAK